MLIEGLLIVYAHARAGPGPIRLPMCGSPGPWRLQRPGAVVDRNGAWGRPRRAQHMGVDMAPGMGMCIQCAINRRSI